jgi:hypothetical protein
MFGSEVLDIGLGLVLMFLLMSLVLTAVQETIESILKTRAGDLNRAMFELLQRDNQLLEKFYDHPLIFALHRGGRTEPGSEMVNATEDYVAPDREARKHLPSYIPRETFAAALLDLLRSGEAQNPKLIQAYDGLNRLTGGDLGKLRTEVESWYDGAMDRASGWFKRRTHRSLFYLGLGAAVLLNVNSFVVARHLATDEQARIYAASYAEEVVKGGQPTPDKIESFRNELENKVGLPIGWSDAARGKLRQAFPDGKLGWSSAKFLPSVAGVGAFVALVGGYFVTAFAMMLGAPFWFDVLNRIMVIRSTVKPKEKSPDEPSEDGGTDKAGARPAAGTAAAPAAAGSSAAAAAAGPIGDAGDEPEPIDGCIEDLELEDDEVTDDIELPPASGGVATS